MVYSNGLFTQIFSSQPLLGVAYSNVLFTTRITDGLLIFSLRNPYYVLLTQMFSFHKWWFTQIFSSQPLVGVAYSNVLFTNRISGGLLIFSLRNPYQVLLTQFFSSQPFLCDVYSNFLFSTLIRCCSFKFFLRNTYQVLLTPIFPSQPLLGYLFTILKIKVQSLAVYTNYPEKKAIRKIP